LAGFFSRLIHRIQPPRQTTQAEVLSGGPAVFSPFSGNAYESDIYRAAVDAIARNAAKLKPAHVITSADGRKDGDNALNYILSVRPNPYMSTYDTLYKLTTHYYLYNNAFAWLQKDTRGNLAAVWPVRPQSLQYVTDESGTLYAALVLADGRKLTLPYSELFTARRFYNSNDLLGDTNTAILPTLDLAHVQSEGMENAIKSSATIRGILKITGHLNDELLKKRKDAFVADYLSATNSGGVAAIDGQMDYQPLENAPLSIDDKQLAAVKSKIYEYLGISEPIVNSTYTEDQYSAFYESVLEPLALQFSQELTDKLFTTREQAFGNQIILEGSRMMFASNASKTTMLKDILPLGLFTINEAREILNLPPVEDGDKRLQTLNVVDANKANQYQTGQSSNQPKNGPVNQMGDGSNEGNTSSED
jgi:HK97 family phage portal protein